MTAREHVREASKIAELSGTGSLEYRHARAAEAQAHALAALAMLAVLKENLTLPSVDSASFS